MDIQQISSECITYDMDDFGLDLKKLFKIFVMDIQQVSSECIKYDLHYFGLDFKDLLYLYQFFFLLERHLHLLTPVRLQ